MTQYNEFTVEENELGEEFTATVTDDGVHLEHNWIDGGLFIPHETWRELDAFRVDFLTEIDETTD